MAALDSLYNPVSRLAVLPDAMNVNKDPTTNSLYWDVASQYYANDVVLSPTNGGAYVMVGGPEGLGGHLLAVRGGDDPALDTTGTWTRLSQSSWEGAAPALTFAVGAAASAVVAVTAGAAYPVVGGYSYSVQFQGSVTGAGAQTVADYTTWTFTPNGAGAVPVSVDVLPRVGVTSVNFAVSAIVTVPALGTTITLSGAKANPSSQDLTVAGSWSFTQIG